MIIRYGVLILLSTLLMSGCQILPQEALPHSEPLSNQFSCGLVSAQLKEVENGAVLVLADRTIAMGQVESASGVHYQSLDAQSEFWHQGAVARLVVDGTVWPECFVTGTVPSFLEARGNEPFWHLRFQENRAVLNRLGFNQVEEGLIVERLTNESAAYAILHFGSDQEQLTLEHTYCQDSMTGMPYPGSVQLTRDGQTLHGCAGKPYDLLQGPQWRVTTLLGKKVPENIDLSMYFSEDRRLSGKAACNRFAGSVRLSGEGLELGRLVSTRMGCVRDLMEWEQSFLNALAEVSRFSLTEDQQLVLFIGDTPALLADF